MSVEVHLERNEKQRISGDVLWSVPGIHIEVEFNPAFPEIALTALDCVVADAKDRIKGGVSGHGEP